MTGLWHVLNGVRVSIAGSRSHVGIRLLQVCCLQCSAESVAVVPVHEYQFPVLTDMRPIPVAWRDGFCRKIRKRGIELSISPLRRLHGQFDDELAGNGLALGIMCRSCDHLVQGFFEQTLQTRLQLDGRSRIRDLAFGVHLHQNGQYALIWRG